MEEIIKLSYDQETRKSICKTLNISRTTLYNWEKKHIGLRDAINEANDLGKIDRVEKAKLVIDYHLEENDLGAAKWVLENYDKSIERKKEGDININIDFYKEKIAKHLSDKYGSPMEG